MDLSVEIRRIYAALHKASAYIKFSLKWIVIASVTGAIGGLVGAVFYKSISFVTEIRNTNSIIILFMPIAGLIIAGIYKITGMIKNKGTDAVIESVHSGNQLPVLLAPDIFIGTVLTHLVGGSAGREGAALQLGGSIGSFVGKIFRMRRDDMRMIVMCGMSAVFSALFGTPITAAFFAMEVTAVGAMFYSGLIPCIISSSVAYAITLLLGIPPTHFDIPYVPELSAMSFVKTAVLAAACAVLSVVFCILLHKTSSVFKRTFKNVYIRILVGSVLLIIMTWAVGCFDYNGAGTDIISKAISGEAKPWAFACKMIFTAVTLGCGFRGGEIVPTFFVGSTFGCAAAGFIGLEPGFGAAVGMIALFCGVVNCPVASVFLSVELFGSEGILLFVLACGVSYMLSGYSGLYGSQRFAYSKFKNKSIDITTK